MEYIPGQVIVRFREDSLRPALGASDGQAFSVAAVGALSDAVLGPLKYLQKNAGLKHIWPAFSDERRTIGVGRRSGVTTLGMATLASVAGSEDQDLRGYSVFALDPTVINKKLLKRIDASPAIELVEPMPAGPVYHGAGGESRSVAEPTVGTAKPSAGFKPNCQMPRMFR